MVLDRVGNFFVDGKRRVLRKEVVLMLNAEVAEVAEKKFEEIGVVLVFEIEKQHDANNVLYRNSMTRITFSMYCFLRGSFRKLDAEVLRMLAEM
eukprot:g45282.t1